jgi:hypothetical protein
MEDFTFVYLNEKDEWPDHLLCKHCGERVERGIISVSHHWMNCLKRTEGLVILKDQDLIKMADSWSINVDEKGKKLF